MASISKDKNGTKRIVYYNTSKKQESIRLGNTTMKDAQTIKVHVENLLSAQAFKVSVATETAEWLSKIPDQLYEKFVQKGFVPPRRVVGTLGEMIPQVIKEKSSDSKPATIERFRQAERCLYEYFEKNQNVDSITGTDAKEFKKWLAQKGSLKTSSPLKPTTVAKRMQHVSSFFHKMKEDGDIPRNPFRKLAKKAAVDKTRNRYIDEETILQVMEYAADAEWRLSIALWRFAGLRAVSEVLMLKWEDILWDQKKIVVHSPKTEQHEGKGTRIIPFFPHVEGCLEEAFEQAPDGAVYVVEKHAPLYLRGKKERVYVSRQGNIGTTFRKIIHRAGIVPWDKLIQNLRASFETDLLNGKYGKFGLHTIAAWLGHSVKVMLEHYGRFQQSDFDQIAEACLQVKQRKEQATQKAAHFAADSLLQNSLLTAEKYGFK
jgi:integrase